MHRSVQKSPKYYKYKKKTKRDDASTAQHSLLWIGRKPDFNDSEIHTAQYEDIAIIRPEQCSASDLQFLAHQVKTHTLTLEYVPLNNLNIDAVCTLIRNCPLTKFRLNYQPLTNACFEKLYEALVGHKTLEVLDLTGITFTKDMLEYMLSLIVQIKELRILDLASAEIDSKCLSALKKVAARKNVTVLCQNASANLTFNQQQRLDIKQDAIRAKIDDLNIFLMEECDNSEDREETRRALFRELNAWRVIDHYDHYERNQAITDTYKHLEVKYWQSGHRKKTLHYMHKRSSQKESPCQASFAYMRLLKKYAQEQEDGGTINGVEDGWHVNVSQHKTSPAIRNVSKAKKRLIDKCVSKIESELRENLKSGKKKRTLNRKDKGWH